MNIQSHSIEELQIELQKLKEEHELLKSEFSKIYEESINDKDEIFKIKKNYEDFFNNIDEFLFVLDLEGKIIQTNQTVIERLGFSKNELYGKSVLIVHPIERREEAGRIVSEMLAGKAEFCPVPIVTKSGQQIPVETRVKVGQWNGKPCLYGVTKDISKLRLSEEKFSKIFYLNPAACGLNDLVNNQYVEINSAFTELLGYSAEEVIGKTAIELGILSEEAKVNILKYSDSNGKVSNVETTLIAKDGSIKHILISAENIYIQNQKFRFTIVNDITELTQSNEALRKSEFKYKGLFDTLPIGVTLADEKGQIIESNAAATNILGLNIEEQTKRQIDGVEWAIIRHNGTIMPQEEYASVIALKENRTVTNIEMGVIKSSDNIAWLSVNASPIEGLGVIITYQDISERVNSQKELLEERQRLAGIIEGTNVGTWEWNVKTGNTIFNERWANIIGYTLDEISPTSIETWMKFAHPDDLIESNKLIMKHFNGELDYYEFESRMLHKNGYWKWVLDRGRVSEWDEKGVPVLMSGTHQDITERKIAEEILLETQRRLELVLEAGDYGFWDWNLISNDTYFSPVYYTMLGYEFQELPNHFETFDKLLHPDDKIRVMPIIEKAIKNGENYEVEFRLICKNGSYKWISGKGKGYFNDDSGKPYRAVGIHIDIDAKKKAQEELIYQKEQFELAVNGTNDGIWDWNLLTNELFLSKRWKEILGYEDFELNNEFLTFDSLLFEEDVPVVNDYVSRYLSGEIEKYQIEFRMKHKNGSLVWILAKGEALRDENGLPYRMAGSHSDITKRKQAETNLLLSEKKYRTIFENVQDIFFQIDPDGIIIEISPSIERYSGFTRESLLGMPVQSVYQNPEDRYEVIRELQLNGEISDFELNLKNRNGHLIIVSLNAHLWKDINGNVIGIEGSLRDISQRKRFENELKENEQYLKAVFNVVGSGIVIVNANDNKILDINKAAIDMIGTSQEEIIGKECKLFFENKEKLYCPIDGKADITEYFEDKLLCANGELKDVMKTGYPIKYRSIDCYLESFMDISQLVEKEKSLKELNDSLYESKKLVEESLFEKNVLLEDIISTKEKLEEINSEKDKFFSIIAHDLKSPFSGFLGLTKILVDDFQDLSINDIKELSQSMQNSAMNLYKLLENLLEWSRMQRGLIKFQPDSCLLDFLVKQIIIVQNDVFKKKDITIVNNIPKDFVIVADQSMLNSILRNLISNAIKFTYRGGKIEIGSSINTNDNSALIYVKDNGIGINQDDLSKLFKIDSKISRPGTENEPSTGLGLLLCYEFVEKHNGKIWAESEVGVGTTMFIRLPKL